MECGCVLADEGCGGWGGVGCHCGGEEEEGGEGVEEEGVGEHFGGIGCEEGWILLRGVGEMEVK